MATGKKNNELVKANERSIECHGGGGRCAKVELSAVKKLRHSFFRREGVKWGGLTSGTAKADSLIRGDWGAGGAMRRSLKRKEGESPRDVPQRKPYPWRTRDPL